MFSDSKIASLALRIANIATPRPPQGEGFIFPETSQRYPPSPVNFWQAQWYAGQAADGRIGDYAESTKRRKKRRGLPYDRVVLYETGRLYGATSLEGYGRDLVLRVKVPYASFLEQRYGDRIWWLGGGFRHRFISKYIRLIRKHILDTAHGRGGT